MPPSTSTPTSARDSGNWTLGDDDALLDVVTSANVACGFHASDASIMRRVCAKAVESGVVIGAQVGYRDLPGFGRRFIDIEPDALTHDVIYQIGALEAFARAAGGTGRLRQAARRALQRDRPPRGAGGGGRRGDPRPRPDAAGDGPARLGLAPSRRRQAGLTTVQRGVRRPGLHARGHAGLATAGRARCSTTPTTIAQRCVAMAAGEPIEDVEGGSITLRPDSICVHGDTPGAVEIARRGPRARSRTAGVDVRPFVAARLSGCASCPAARPGCWSSSHDLDEVLGLYGVLEADPPAGVVDVVPAARTVLLVLDPAATTPDRVRVGRRGAAGTERPGGRGDGDRELRRGPRRLRRRGPRRRRRAPRLRPRRGGPPAHRRAVDGGVLRLRPRLRLPHRRRGRLEHAAPRQPRAPRCRAGSVALAGEFSGVYPRESPGGWQLIGRTDLAVFDLDRDPPALLAPATRVRFVEVGS